MQYTTSPVSHMGLVYFMLIMVCILAACAYFCSIIWFKVTFLAAGALALFTAHSVYVDNKLLKNEKITVNMVGHETRQERDYCGKACTRNINRLYVFYETPDGIISYARSSGIIYPERAILYRNERK